MIQSNPIKPKQTQTSKKDTNSAHGYAQHTRINTETRQRQKTKDIDKCKPTEKQNRTTKHNLIYQSQAVAQDSQSDSQTGQRSPPSKKPTTKDTDFSHLIVVPNRKRA